MGGRGGSGQSKAASGGGSSGDDAPTQVGEFLSAYRSEVAKVTNSSGWVKLANMRDALPNMSRGEFDTLLTQLTDARRVILIPEENQKTLRQRDREAALSYGGEPNHLIRVE